MTFAPEGVVIWYYLALFGIIRHYLGIMGKYGHSSQVHNNS